MIYNEAVALLKANWDKKIPIRMLGVTISGIVENNNIINDEKKSKEELLEKCLDKIIDKYGNGIITRATLINK